MVWQNQVLYQGCADTVNQTFRKRLCYSLMLWHEVSRGVASFSQIFTKSSLSFLTRSSWPRPRGPGFDSRRYQIFCVAVGLERDPLSLVRINEDLLERKVAAPV
jgi:hypothetical protein